jgi:hypothetical protein
VTAPLPRPYGLSGLVVWPGVIRLVMVGVVVAGVKAGRRALTPVTATAPALFRSEVKCPGLGVYGVAY